MASASSSQQVPQKMATAREQPREHSAYRGFLAGVASGVAKQTGIVYTVGHPFDTIKVRMQTNPSFRGPLDCLLTTLRNEGIRGLYKGATPPLVGWMAMDAIMLGSLSNYRAFLKSTFYPTSPLPDYAHGLAGIGAGWTVSFVAAPVEHIKARLQVQYNSTKSGAPPRYKGPIDCTRQIYSTHGIRGLYKGLFATMLFRTFFFFWWGSYSLFSRALRQHTDLSEGMVNFWAGGCSAQVFWMTCYPVDVVKQRIMVDSLEAPKYRRWRDAAADVWRGGMERGGSLGRLGGVTAFYRGFVPSILRAFPANAAALVAFEWAMRGLP